MNYAIIKDGVVVNIIVLNPQNARDFPNAVKLEVGATIGDTYENGKFYRDGVEVISTEQGLIIELADAIAALELLGVTPEEGETNE